MWPVLVLSTDLYDRFAGAFNGWKGEKKTFCSLQVQDKSLQAQSSWGVGVAHAHNSPSQ